MTAPVENHAPNCLCDRCIAADDARKQAEDAAMAINRHVEEAPEMQFGEWLAKNSIVHWNKQRPL